MERFIATWPRACRIAAAVIAAVALGAVPARAGHHEAKSEHAEAEHGESEHGEAGGGEAADAETNGIKLGEFKVRTDYPVEAQKCTVRFVLYASVGEERRDDMRRLAAAHQQRIRDVVIVATRLAPLNVFEEPDLAKFRRRIFIRLRQSLPEFAFDELYVSDFGLLVRSL